MYLDTAGLALVVMIEKVCFKKISFRYYEKTRIKKPNSSAFFRSKDSKEVQNSKYARKRACSFWFDSLSTQSKSGMSEDNPNI
jgi:hypothetical protein